MKQEFLKLDEAMNAVPELPDYGSSKYVVTGKLKLIEQQLISIDSAAFQNLCDVYLASREQPTSMSRTGSQLGKQKTVKGTPDTFFRLSDGNLYYIEYTTQADGLIEKIKNDIDKCLDSSKTGVDSAMVHKIIICFNSRLEVASENVITRYAASKGIGIELIGLDWLALEIYSKYPILAKDILGIPIDTGQLLPLQKFVAEYNNKAGKLSTPLDNVFLNRKSELEEISDVLLSRDLLVIAGFPGVGKTKIALEAISKFLTLNSSYSAYAISKKDQDISDDLKIYLQQEKDYVLLVDDANRQLPNFKQILGIFRENRKGNIKLVITVRDYALSDVLNECSEFGPHELPIKKFTDDEITELISSDSFKIKNPEYQKKIVAVSDGNARLAVMAARLAKEKQVEFLLGDVTDLYDTYFQTFIKDHDIFGNKSLTKTLGIVSFFFSVNRNDKEFIDTLLSTFEISYYDFNEAIGELEKREFIEVKYNIARVSEQVMATYFFYKVFVLEDLLSFKKLLYAFFPKWKRRFSDTIIPTNNSFGYENVLNKIDGILDDYFNSIKEDEDGVMEFFSMFWFYKRQEMLCYFHEKIKRLPEPEQPFYATKYKTNDFGWKKDKTLSFLANLFDHQTESFIPSLELAFEYCRKSPEHLPELMKKIRDTLLFDREDYRVNFNRQFNLFNLIIRKLKDGEEHYTAAFFDLAGTFLSYNYQIAKAERNSSVSFYQHALPYDELIVQFRSAIWVILFENFDNYPNEVLSVLNKYTPYEANAKLLESDLSLLLPFIEARLEVTSFDHIVFIRDFIKKLDRTAFRDTISNLRGKLNGWEYECLERLDWSTLRGRHRYEFKDSKKFRSLKEQEVRGFFLFSTNKEFVQLQAAIRNISSLESNDFFGLYESLNIIVEENFIRNNDLGFELLESILAIYPRGLRPLHLAIRTIACSSELWAKKLWEVIKNWRHEYQLSWKLSFFDHLPLTFANGFYKDALLATIETIAGEYTLEFESFEKFLPIDRDIILNILNMVVDKNDKQEKPIRISYDFFEKYGSMLAGNFDLLAKAFLQQEKRRNDGYGHNEKGLQTLVRINPDFLLVYITQSYLSLDNRSLDSHRRLSFVWDLHGYKSLVKEAANFIIANAGYYSIGGHPLIVFFRFLNNEQQLKAKEFMLEYISDYNCDSYKMNAVFAVLRHSMKDFFDTAFLYYIGMNTSLEDFMKISWRGNGGIYGGGVIIGEIHAKEWQRLLALADISNNQLEIIPIKGYMKRMVADALRNAEQDRKIKFIDPRYG